MKTLSVLAYSSVFGLSSAAVYAQDVAAPQLMSLERAQETPAAADPAPPDGAMEPAGSSASMETPEATETKPEILDTIPVAAREDPLPQPEQTRSSSRLIEEVVVTAQKREQNLQDVPISVAAFSAEVLDAKGVLTSQDLPLVTPGLTLSTSVNFLTVFVRGVGSDAFLVADPSVASYVDGIYFPFSNGAVQDFGALERIEVLKGPQGTLFGRNAVGGAINVITKAPALDRTEISVQSSYAEYSTTSNRIHVSVPLIEDQLALSASLVYNHGDNYIDGTADGKPLQKDETKGARMKLRWAPAEWMDLTLAALRIEQEGAGSDYAPNAQPSVLGKLLLIQPQDPYAGASNEPIFFSHENTTFYGQLNLFPGPFDIRLIGGHQDLESMSNYDFDGSPMPLVFFQIEPGAAKVKSLELQVLSNDDTWASEHLNWILGAYYFQSEAGFPQGFAQLAETNLDQGRVLGIQLPTDFLDQIKGIVGDRRLPTGAVDFVGLLDTESISFFAQATYHLTDWMALTLGGRYQEDERFIIESSAGLRNFDGSQTPLFHFSADNNERWRDKENSFKPKVSLDFRPGSGWLGMEPLLYLSWQQAIKGSSYNVVNITDSPDYVKPEEMEAYEAGIKTRLFDGLVTFNFAVFDYDIKNPQVQFVSFLKGGVVSFENAGRAKVQGAEFDVVAQLLPSLTDGLVLTASAVTLDPKYTSYERGSGYDEATGLLRTNLDFSGNQIVRSPKFSGTVGLSQTIQTGIGPFELGADYFHTSKIYFLAQNSDFSKQGAYGVIGARISYLYEPWNIRLTVFGKNIGNERYVNSLVLTDFGRNEARAPLSIYGVRLNWDF